MISRKAYEALLKGAYLGCWQELLRKASQMVQADLGKTSLPSPDEMIHPAQEERDARLNRMR